MKLKLSGLRMTRWGIAMTEYLILLGIVAIAAILVVTLFGSSIKATFSKSTSALNGQNDTAADATTKANKTSSDTDSAKKDDMGTFDTKSQK